MKVHPLLLFTVMAAVSPLPSYGAYVRGDLVWNVIFMRFVPLLAMRTAVSSAMPSLASARMK